MGLAVAPVHRADGRRYGGQQIPARQPNSPPPLGTYPVDAGTFGPFGTQP
jgi:hypothetical protein